MRTRVYRLDGVEELGFTVWKEYENRVYRLEGVGELGFIGWKEWEN